MTFYPKLCDIKNGYLIEWTPLYFTYAQMHQNFQVPHFQICLNLLQHTKPYQAHIYFDKFLCFMEPPPTSLLWAVVQGLLIYGITR